MIPPKDNIKNNKKTQATNYLYKMLLPGEACPQCSAATLDNCQV
jgi:hypothetical protein